MFDLRYNVPYNACSVDINVMSISQNGYASVTVHHDYHCLLIVVVVVVVVVVVD